MKTAKALYLKAPYNYWVIYYYLNNSLVSSRNCLTEEAKNKHLREAYK